MNSNILKSEIKEYITHKTTQCLYREKRYMTLIVRKFPERENIILNCLLEVIAEVLESRKAKNNKVD